jgi:hypothetical protein
MNSIPSIAERQRYDHHHRDENYFTTTKPETPVAYDFHPDPPPAAPAAARPAPVVELPVYRGRFVKGHDPRRHHFTPDEIALGYENAKLSVDERFPDARCKHGAALSHCFLRAKHPQFFIDRQAEKRAA